MQEVDLDLDDELSKYYFEPITFAPLAKRPAFKPCVNYDVVTKRTRSLDRGRREEETKFEKKLEKRASQYPVSQAEGSMTPSFCSLATPTQSASAPAMYPTPAPDPTDEFLSASLIPEQDLWQPLTSSESMSSLSSFSSSQHSSNTSNFSSNRSQQPPLLITSPASPRAPSSPQNLWPTLLPSSAVSSSNEGASGYLSPVPANQEDSTDRTPSIESFEDFQFTPPDYNPIQEAPRCAAPDPLTMLFGDISGKKSKEGGNTPATVNPKALTSKLSMIGLKKPKKQLSSYKIDGRGEGVGNDNIPVSPGFQKVRESKLKPRSLTFTSNSVFRPFALNKSEAIRSSSVTAFHRAPHKESRATPDRTFPLSNISGGDLSEDPTNDGSGTANLSTIPMDAEETSISDPTKVAEAVSILKKEGGSSAPKTTGKLTDKDGLFGVFSKLMKEDKKEQHKDKVKEKMQRKKEKEREREKEKEEKREKEKKNRIKRRSQLYSFSFSEKESSEKPPVDGAETIKAQEQSNPANFASASLPSIPSYGKHKRNGSSGVSSRSSSGSLANDKGNDIKFSSEKPALVSPIAIPLIFQSASSPAMPTDGTLPAKRATNKASLKGMILSSKGVTDDLLQAQPNAVATKVFTPKEGITQKALTPAPLARGTLTSVKMTPPISKSRQPSPTAVDDSIPPSLPSIKALSPFSRANLGSVTPGTAPSPAHVPTHLSPTKELTPGNSIDNPKNKRSSVSLPISTAIALFSGSSNSNTNPPKPSGASKALSRKAANRNSVNITSTYGNSFNQAFTQNAPISKLSASYSSVPMLGPNVLTARTVSSPDSPPVSSKDRDAPSRITKNPFKVQLTGSHSTASGTPGQQHSPNSSPGNANTNTNTAPTLRHTAGNTIKNISNALLKSYKASTSGPTLGSTASSIKPSSSDFEICKLKRGEPINPKDKEMDKNKDKDRESISAPALPAYSVTGASPSLLPLKDVKGGSLRDPIPANRPFLIHNRLVEISRESTSSLSSSHNTSTSSYSSSLSVDETQDDISPVRSPQSPTTATTINTLSPSSSGQTPTLKELALMSKKVTN